MTDKTTKPKTKTKTPTPKRTASPASKGKYYIDRKELFAEVLRSKELGRMSDRLAVMLQLLASKYAKSSQYVGYPYNDDMQSYAIMMLVKTWSAFDPAKSDNPFAFYTQCIKNSFNQYLNKEKHHRNIRDALLVKQGLSPSYTYQAEYRDKMDEARSSYEEDDHFNCPEPQKTYGSEDSGDDL